MPLYLPDKSGRQRYSVSMVVDTEKLKEMPIEERKKAIEQYVEGARYSLEELLYKDLGITE